VWLSLSGISLFPTVCLFVILINAPHYILYPPLSDYLFKLLLIGDSGVGKSCLLLRFAVSYNLICLVIICGLLYNVNFAVSLFTRMTRIQKVISVQLE